MTHFTKWILFFLIAISFSVFAETKDAKPTGPTPSVLKQVGMVKVQFDLNRVTVPTPIQNTNNPTTWRAYLPACPADSNYVSGVKPNLLELDQGPDYAYCNCICNGNCSRLTGVSSPAGRLPLYKASVTCSTTIQGWFDSSVFAQTSMPNLTAVPHEFYYCQSGSCATNPLPSNLNYTVPVGGFANTVKIDFMACNIAAIKGCGAPDPSSIGKAATTMPS